MARRMASSGDGCNRLCYLLSLISKYSAEQQRHPGPDSMPTRPQL